MKQKNKVYGRNKRGKVNGKGKKIKLLHLVVFCFFFFPEALLHSKVLPGCWVHYVILSLQMISATPLPLWRLAIILTCLHGIKHCSCSYTFIDWFQNPSRKMLQNCKITLPLKTWKGDTDWKPYLKVLWNLPATNWIIV